MKKIISLSLLIIVLSSFTTTDYYRARIIQIVDADTYIVSHAGVNRKVNLYGVYCPTSEQSTNYVKFRILNQELLLCDHGLNNAAYEIDVVFPNKERLGNILLEKGYAKRKNTTKETLLANQISY